MNIRILKSFLIIPNIIYKIVRSFYSYCFLKSTRSEIEDRSDCENSKGRRNQRERKFPLEHSSNSLISSHPREIFFYETAIAGLACLHYHARFTVCCSWFSDNIPWFSMFALWMYSDLYKWNRNDALPLSLSLLPFSFIR